MRTTFNISYYCRESKSNKQGLSPLELCININGERLFINLPIKFNYKDFNKKRKPQHIQNLLNEYHIKINELVYEIMNNGLPVTSSTLREYLRTGGTKTYTVQMMVEKYMDNIKTKTTGDAYNKYKLVADYLIGELGDRQLTAITNGDMINIYDQLKLKYLIGTAAGKMIKIKSMFQYATDNGLIRTNPCNCIKVSKGSTTIKYLTVDELDKISGLDLSDYERLDKVRDLMLFQSATGVAYADLVTFDTDNIKQINGVYTYTNNRQKTGIEFTSVILPIGIDILNKYNGYLPLISNQKYNAYLKEIQKLAGIKTNITTHLLRKTYATRLLNAGVNISVVAKTLGHSNTTITQRCYAKTTNSFVANEIGNAIKGGLL